jgi:hypothetical protein
MKVKIASVRHLYDYEVTCGLLWRRPRLKARRKVPRRFACTAIHIAARGRVMRSVTVIDGTLWTPSWGSLGTRYDLAYKNGFLNVDNRNSVLRELLDENPSSSGQDVGRKS